MGYDILSGLTADFTMSDLSKTNYNIDNRPSAAEYDTVEANLRALAVNIIQKTSDHFGIKATVSSGFRNYAVNTRAGGVKNSQHRIGQAVDMKILGVDNLTVARWIRDNCDFDQLILEEYDGGNSGWIHISYRRSVYGRNRKRVLRKPGKAAKYFPGLPTSEASAKIESAAIRTAEVVKIVGLVGVATGIVGLAIVYKRS